MSDEIKERYWGAYCPQCNIWLRRKADDLVFYPHPEIAKAEIQEVVCGTNRIIPRAHLWQATEYGKQQAVDASTLRPEDAVCPYQRADAFHQRLRGISDAWEVKVRR